MKVNLCFDYYSKIIYIPDGYITDLKKMQHSFFEWMDSQPPCLVDKGVSYDEDDFLKYVNNEVLMESREKAYVLSDESKKEFPKLKF